MEAKQHLINYLEDKDNYKVSVGDDINSSDVHLKKIDKILDKIKYDAEITPVIEKIRLEPTKSRRDELKKTLPYFIVAKFKGRRKNINLLQVQHFIIDIDHVENLKDKKEELKKDLNVFAVFISPSGDGLKIIYIFDKPIDDPKRYSDLYKYYAKKFRGDYEVITDKTSDVARPCYFSYDPDIYINKDAVPLATDITIEVEPKTKKVTETEGDGKRSEMLDILNNGVFEGNRNTSLVKLVGLHYSKGFDLDFTTAAMVSWNKNNIPPLPENELVSQVKSMYSNFSKPAGGFYEIDKDNNVKIDIVKYIDFLEESGFFKLYKFDKMMYIKSENKIISQTSIPQIKDFVRAEVENKPERNKILNKLINNENKYFSNGLTEFLKPIEAKIRRDPRDRSYFYFKNVWVEVEGGGEITTHPYSELEGFIWKQHIVDRNYKTIKDVKDSDFRKFVWLLAGENEDRFEAICSVIGYMLHTYKDPNNAKAVILMDERISDNPDGRSGKSLVTKAISKVRNTRRLDGKFLKFTGDDRFSLQEIEVEDQVLDFNDLNRNFPYEQLFSIITDIMPVEKKRMNKVSIPFEEAPKIIMSTNYTLKGIGGSYTDRFYEIEISSYFSADKKPLDIFKKRFFDDWDDEEWLKFDNFMIWCTSVYLEKGLIQAEPINILTRKLYNETSKEFVEFVTNNVTVGEEYSINVQYNNFIKAYPDFSSIKQNTFTKWLKNYCTIKKLDFSHRDSNGKRYFTFNE